MAEFQFKPLKFEREFKICKRQIKGAFKIDFSVILALEYGYKVPKRQNGEFSRKASGQMNKLSSTKVTKKLILFFLFHLMLF